MPLEISFLFGGISSEYDASISSLTHIISSFLVVPHEQRPFSVKNMYHISRDDGLVRTIPFHSAFTIAELQTYISGPSKIPGRALLSFFDESYNEYIVNLLTGQFGEDGGVQTIAYLSGIEGTFGDPQTASLTMNKYAMSSFVSSILTDEVVRVPDTEIVNYRNFSRLRDISRSLRFPIVIKPNSLGSSLFATLVHESSAAYAEIFRTVGNILEYDSTALLQQFVPGDEYSCGCRTALLQQFVPGDEYSCGCVVTSRGVSILPVAKIDTNGNFFGYDEKSDDNLSEINIIDIDNPISKRIKEITRSIVFAVGISNMARLDFRVDSNLEVWFLECNSIPYLGENGLYARMLRESNMSILDLISIISSKSKSFVRKPHMIQ
ncbi:D-alanine--D-alanine ligase [Mesorhizobium silamurunense]|uniref:D-alanine--D-alanine ligase n=1 Tax=Mesorhizobium silamurunense TaxID=499528 RepID=UPI001783B6C0|nr:D-alanine--D-alanine ligase [Mesorhizobium silamurunense]